MKTISNQLSRQYFDWMVSILIPDVNKRVVYSNLLDTLNSLEFIPSMDMDYNRLNDGRELRYRFGNDEGFGKGSISCYLDLYPCSMLEMMCALSLRIEETIMSDPEIGDRTWFWFDEMLNSLGLIGQINYNFDYGLILSNINAFNRRQYDSNGRGGLFTIDDPSVDLRGLEIWYQMNLYIKQVDVRDHGKIYV